MLQKKTLVTLRATYSCGINAIFISTWLSLVVFSVCNLCFQRALSINTFSGCSLALSAFVNFRTCCVKVISDCCTASHVAFITSFGDCTSFCAWFWLRKVYDHLLWTFLTLGFAICSFRMFHNFDKWWQFNEANLLFNLLLTSILVINSFSLVSSASATASVPACLNKQLYADFNICGWMTFRCFASIKQVSNQNKAVRTSQKAVEPMIMQTKPLNGNQQTQHNGNIPCTWGEKTTDIFLTSDQNDPWPNLRWKHQRIFVTSG